VFGLWYSGQASDLRKGTRILESDKRSAMLIWASIGAAAASIVAVAVLVRLRSARLNSGELSTRLRDVQDVLTDINRKIQEIEEHIPEIPAARRVESSLLGSARTVANGSPAQ
jgi:hypothetical protein